MALHVLSAGAGGRGTRHRAPLLIKECDRKFRTLGHMGLIRLNFKSPRCTSRHCRVQTLGPRLN